MRWRCAGAGRRRTRAGSGASAYAPSRPARAARATRSSRARPRRPRWTSSGSPIVSAIVGAGRATSTGPGRRSACRAARRAGARVVELGDVARRRTSTAPAVGSTSRSTSRATVDLPEPLSPTSPSVSPARDREVDAVDRAHARRSRAAAARCAPGSPCAARVTSTSSAGVRVGPPTVAPAGAVDLGSARRDPARGSARRRAGTARTPPSSALELDATGASCTPRRCAAPGGEPAADRPRVGAAAPGRGSPWSGAPGRRAPAASTSSSPRCTGAAAVRTARRPPPPRRPARRT